MSLYGNIKKVDSSVFQFDKIYSSRVDLENNESSDGVYAGRYVLVEYGERWERLITDYTNENTDVYAVINGIKVRETRTYRENAEKDLIRFGAIYDSTVWQKIYFQGHDKYIMIAELNALAPKLDMESHEPITYVKQGQNIENPSNGLLAGSFDEDTQQLEIVRLINAREQYNSGYFDNIRDTEVSYLLHYPKSLQIEVGDQTINYNEKGFNPIYSYGEVDGPSAIALIPELKDNYTILMQDDHITPQKDNNGYYLAELKQNTDVDTKTLFINLPVFGNMMNTIYNLIYGIPATSDLSEGALRPYFKQYLRYNNFINTVKVQNINGDFEPLIIDGEIQKVEGHLEEYISTTNSWEPVVKKFEYIDENDIVGKEISPDFIVVKYKGNNGNFYNVGDPEIDSNLSGLYVLYNTLLEKEFTWTMQPPSGDDNFVQGDLNNVTDLSDLSKINSVGLASILQDLFGVKDPITGLARYFLYNDWTSNSNGEDSAPMILNKPYVVGGNQENYEYVERRLPWFEPDRQTGEDKIVGKKQFHVLQTSTSNTFSGGHYSID